ncbi:MAG: hypothetical protein SGARI_005761, partial [Bacillariaceae sp.]
MISKKIVALTVLMAVFPVTIPAPAGCVGTTQNWSNSVYTAYNNKFKAVIDNSISLQHPGTSTCLTKGDIQNANYLNAADTKFKVNGDERLRFDFRNGSAGHRMELRGQSFSWSSQDKRWEGKFYFPDRDGSRFTVGQIFGYKYGSNGWSKPILRIEYKDNGNLYAVLRRSPFGNGNVKTQNLGLAPTATSSGHVKVVYRPNGTNKIVVKYKAPGQNSFAEFEFNLKYEWREDDAVVYHKA